MKRTNVFAGALLGGVLLVGTAGLALAQDPVAPPPSPVTGMSGGMMGGDMNPAGMSHGGMMVDMNPAGTSGMGDMARMGTDGSCDAGAMQDLHAQHHAAS